ncbi:MAG: hypothetical protein QOD06_911 [Candidatus Binatota bacterium]|nr:hypothetical protein [Candidatus Binatota bacterium]
MRRPARALSTLLLLALTATSGCRGEPHGRSAHRVLVLGFDGVDPILLDRFVAEGALPNFAKLARPGHYRRLATTVPPQSPVAWSTFITGLDPGGHGIYDFIHRDPNPAGGGAIFPYLSTSRVEEDEWRLTFGKYALPSLWGGEAHLLRHGKAFWNVLEEHGVRATVVKIPANFPPEPTDQRTLSDMGTPDLRGTYGTFFLFSSDPENAGTREVPGGIIYGVRARDGHASGEIPGPPNSFRANLENAGRRFDAWIDTDSRAARIEIGGRSIVLQEGEWSEWLPIDFSLVPAVVSVPGIVRLHLKQVRPFFELYVSPVNIDPTRPALPISTPPEYARELYDRVGYFYTQGLPEDSKALSEGALGDGEYLEQATHVFDERMRLLDTELARFREGLLFVYFGGADQVSHTFWRTLDRPDSGHPNAIRDAYRQLDGALGRAMAAIDPSVPLIVLSDHGFAPFRRSAHLNSWLREQGLLALREGADTSGELFQDVDWTRTAAYAFGLNGLYVNLRGRERYGTVAPESRRSVMDDLVRRLLLWRDPENGAAVVARAYRREEVYSERYRDIAPDLIVGYARGYRVSNQSALGQVTEAVLEDNLDAWSGDHCIAAEEVPGVLLSNRAIRDLPVGLADVAPTVLQEFGVPALPEMIGKPFLETAAK